MSQYVVACKSPRIGTNSGDTGDTGDTLIQDVAQCGA